MTASVFLLGPGSSPGVTVAADGDVRVAAGRIGKRDLTPPDVRLDQYASR
jgi:hypothetical protein